MFILILSLISFGAKYAGEFLDLPVGGRAQGMGSAYITLADNAESPLWNPACIVRDEGKELFLFHSESFGGIVNYNTLSFAISDKRQGVGFAFYQIGVPDMIFTDDTIATDTANINDWVLYLTYGKMVESERFTGGPFSFGINMKVIYRAWKEGSAYGVGIDGGLLYRVYPFSFGVFIENLSTTALFWSTGTREMIPPLFKTGVSYEMPIERFEGKFIIAGGLDTNLENKITQLDAIKSDTHIGMEFIYRDRFAIRGGLDKGNTCFGAGLTFDRFRIDYGQSQHDLGANTRISANLNF